MSERLLRSTAFRARAILLGVRLDLRRYLAVSDRGGLVELIEEELPA